MASFCPISGRSLKIDGFRVHHRQVYVDPRLLERVQETTGLAPAEATRLVEDVLAFHDETVEEWVRRRHGEMKTYGARNDAIFAQLRDDLGGLVVAAPELSERQLRRIVYG